jgi:hypothetical protein
MEMFIPQQLTRYPLLDAVLKRRSRRFGAGMRMDAGPLAFQSRQAPLPLGEAEEAMLVFAASGITGHALLDLCFTPGEGGSIVARSIGRTVASGDAIQTVSLVVTNDEATYLIKRPQDFDSGAIADLIDLSDKREFVDLYRRSRVRLKDGRAAPPLAPLFNVNVNRWSLYAPGTTYFLPINELTFMYVNGLLEIFDEHTGAFVIDERANFRPAGIGRFAQSRGGHLIDNLALGRVLTVQRLELMVAEFVTIEQGMMLQNLALMAQTMGLGGFPNFAEHEYGWFEALGFRMGVMNAGRYLGASVLVKGLMSILVEINRSRMLWGWSATAPCCSSPTVLLTIPVWLRPYEPSWTPSMAREEFFAVLVPAHGAIRKRSRRRFQKSVNVPSMRPPRIVNIFSIATAASLPTCRPFARCWDFKLAISTRNFTSGTTGPKRFRKPSAITWQSGMAKCAHEPRNHSVAGLIL